MPARRASMLSDWHGVAHCHPENGNATWQSRGLKHSPATVRPSSPVCVKSPCIASPATWHCGKKICCTLSSPCKARQRLICRCSVRSWPGSYLSGLRSLKTSKMVLAWRSGVCANICSTSFQSTAKGLSRVSQVRGSFSSDGSLARFRYLAPVCRLIPERALATDSVVPLSSSFISFRTCSSLTHTAALLLS